MNELQKAAKAIDAYAQHAADDGMVGSIPVPVRLLQALRRALQEGGK